MVAELVGIPTVQRTDALLAAVKRAMDTERTPSARLQAIAEAVVRVFDADRCIIGRPVEDTVEAVAGVGMGVASTPGYERLPRGRGIVSRAWREARTQRVDDVLKDPGYFAAAVLTRSELVTPVTRAGTVELLLNVESNRLAAFTPADAEALEEAAKWLSARLGLLGYDSAATP